MPLIQEDSKQPEPRSTLGKTALSIFGFIAVLLLVKVVTAPLKKTIRQAGMEYAVGASKSEQAATMQTVPPTTTQVFAGSAPRESNASTDRAYFGDTTTPAGVRTVLLGVPAIGDDSSGAIHDPAERPDSSLLFLGCLAAGFTIQVRFGTPLGNDGWTSVAYRFDSNDPVTSSWWRSGKFVTTVTTEEFMRQMKTASQVAFHVTSSDGRLHSRSFQVARLNSGIDKLPCLHP